jgi:hypothetical protein
MRFMFVFGLLGMFLAALAMRLTRDAHGAWWWLVSAAGYLASCFLAIAAIYGLRAAGFSVEDIPRRSVESFILRAILLPYLALGGATLYFARWFDSETQWHATGWCVLIHCAQGHGRTATIAAAVLVRLELAADAEEALARVRAVRPFAVPSREQKAALMQYLASARLDRAIPNLSPTEKP